MAKPNIRDIGLLVQAGINPATGLPYKMGGSPCNLKEDIKKVLRIMDEQDAVNRFKWNELPCRLTSQELERFIYYRGQLCFFYLKALDQYFFMPYALDGTIDFYGRFNTIHPVPMSSGVDETTAKAQSDYLGKIKLKVVYDETDIKEDDPYDGYAVLLHDYSKQRSETIIPRQVINDPLLDVMSECIPYMRTSMISATGVKAVRVSDADQSEAVREASLSFTKSALSGEQFIGIIGAMEFQELADAPTSKAEDYFLAMQSLDNLRLQTYGLDNKGLYEKKAHTTNEENSMNTESASAKLTDGLEIRKHFCDLANKLFGLNISVEVDAPESSDMGVEPTTYESEENKNEEDTSL